MLQGAQRGHGGIGRRKGLKIPRLATTVPVRFRVPAPTLPTRDYRASMNSAPSTNDAITPIRNSSTASAFAIVSLPRPGRTYPSAENRLFRLACTQNTPSAAPTKSPLSGRMFRLTVIGAAICSDQGKVWRDCELHRDQFNRRRARAFAAFSVFSIRQAIVIGPTPRGTGVMAPAICTASSKATSPRTS